MPQKAGSCWGQEVFKSSYFGSVPWRGEIRLCLLRNLPNTWNWALSFMCHWEPICLLESVGCLLRREENQREVFSQTKHRSPKGVLVASPASSRPNPTGQEWLQGEIAQHHEVARDVCWQGPGNEDCPFPYVNEIPENFFRVLIDRHKALPCCWCGALPCLWLAEVITAVQNMLFQDQPEASHAASGMSGMGTA